MANNCAKHYHCFKTKNKWNNNLKKKNKQISNYWPDSAGTDIHFNRVEVFEEGICAGEGWTGLRVYL